MIHPQLKRYLDKWLSAIPEEKENLSGMWQVLSDRFSNYDREISILEHTSEMVSEDYENAVKKLRDLNSRLGTAVSVTLDKNELLQQLPDENPNPVYCFCNSGKLLYMNPAAQKLKVIEYNNSRHDALKSFELILPELQDNGQLECTADNRRYIFNYRKISTGDRINFYGTDITEQWELQQRSYDNFYRLNNFLESTEAVHYIVYKKQKEKNFFTSRWPLFFGFNPLKVQDPLEERRKSVVPDSINSYLTGYEQLETEGKATFKYQIVNLITGNKMWLEEEIKKSYDHYLNDEVLTGKITDITGTEFYKEYIIESENRFKNITAALPVMTWVSDSNNRVTYSNDKVREFFGKRMEEFGDECEFEELIHTKDRKRVRELWQTQMKKRLKFESYMRIKGVNDEYSYVQEIASPRFSSGGEFMGYIGSFFDLTKEYNYYAQLEADKKLFELISVNSTDITVITDWKGIISYISPSVKRVLGYTEEEMLNMYLGQLINDDSHSSALAIFSYNEVTAPDVIQTIRFGMTTKKGRTVLVETAVSKIGQSVLQNQHLLLHIRDITEQQNSINALAASEEKFRGLFENMALGVLEVDLEEKTLYCNKAMCNITGFREEELIGKIASELFLRGKVMAGKIEEIQQLRKTGIESVYELTINKKNGDIATMIISGAPLYDKDGQIRGSVGIHWDITEIREMEQKLMESKIKKEQEIVEATLLAEEEQRAQIGRDLHDGVGQMLTYINLYLGIIRSRGVFAPSDVNELEKTVKNTLEQVRTLSRTLAPPAIRDLGLRDAVVELIESYGILEKPRFKLKIYVQKEDNNINLDKKIVTYRVLQELLNNTFKYAEAENISVQLYYLKDCLNLYYSDDGKGFNMKSIRKGVGLESMRSRVGFYKGTINIKSAPGKGIKVNIKLPIK